MDHQLNYELHAVKSLKDMERLLRNHTKFSRRQIKIAISKVRKADGDSPPRSPGWDQNS